MDITKQFQKYCFEIYKQEKEEQEEIVLQQQFEQELHIQEEKQTFKDFIKEIENEIDEKIVLNNQINYDILIGKIDIRSFSTQQHFGEQLNNWAEEKNTKLKEAYIEYVKENKNKKFHINHFDIVVKQVSNKIKTLQKKNSEQMKVIGEILKLDFQLLFSENSNLFPNEQKIIESEKESMHKSLEQPKEEELENSENEELEPKINEPKEIIEIESKEKTEESIQSKEETKENDDKIVHVNSDIFDDFETDEIEESKKEKEDSQLIIDTQPIPKQENKQIEKTIKPIQQPIEIEKVEKIETFDFDDGWEDNDENDYQQNDINDQERLLLQQLESSMEDVHKPILEALDNITTATTKIGEMASIQLERSQRICDCIEDAQENIQVANDHLEEAHEAMQSWWTPRKVAGILFYLAGLLLLLKHFTSA